jgi:hypothetical protein
MDELDAPRTDAEIRRGAADRAHAFTDSPRVKAQLDEWFGVVREPVPVVPDDGGCAATVLVTAMVGLSGPMAAALTFAEQPVAAVGAGLFAVGGLFAVRAMDRDRAGGL